MVAWGMGARGMGVRGKGVRGNVVSGEVVSGERVAPAVPKLLLMLLPALLLLSTGCTVAGSHDCVAVYSNVTGLSLSPDANVRFDRFPKYPLHESSLQLDAAAFQELASGLEVAGFYQDPGLPLPPFALPPMAFHICAVVADKRHQCTYFHRRGHTVPERYLQLLERTVPKPHPPALRKFLKANRELR